MLKNNWWWVAFLCATSSAGYLCRVNVSIAAPLLISEFGFSEVQIGRLFSAFLAGYALFQALGGILADKGGPSKTLQYSALLWFLLTNAFIMVGWLGSGLQWALLLGMALRFLLGVAQAPLFPAAAAAIAVWINPQHQARSNAIVLSGVSIGSAIAPMLVSTIMAYWGWRMAILVSSLPALVVFWVWCREIPPAATISKNQADRIYPPKIGRLSFLRSASFWLLSASYSLQGYVGYIFVFWFYLYLIRVRHFSLLEGAFFSSLPWVLSMISIPLGGWISDCLSSSRLKKQWGRRIVPMVGMSGAGLTLALGAHTQSAYAAALYLALSTSLILCVEGPFWAAVTEISGSHPGAGGGIMNTGCNLGGLISPVLTPWLAAEIGWEKALYLASILSGLGALVWVGIRLPEGSADEPAG